MVAERVIVGAVRAFHFIRLVMPIVLHYKSKQLLARFLGRKISEREWDDVHNYWAPRCLAIAERMQGFYIKVGQHLATVGLNDLPNVYIDNFMTLLEHCPSQPFSTVKEIIEKELGPLARTFESFNEQPMNAASTGQVHSAKLWGGHEVVVKVQHPDAEWTFGVDLQLFIFTAELFQLPGVDIVRQIQDNLNSEFDYAREAEQQRQAATHLLGFPNIVVPLPVDRQHPHTPIPGGLCTKRVLVMDKLFGTSLADWGRAQLESEARLQGKTRQELQDELMKRPPEDMENMRPSALAIAAYVMAIRGMDIACNTPLAAYNWGLGYVFGVPVEYVDTPLPPNIHHITDELLAAQAHLIFRAGFVNADPHAGNVMLLRDGRIALIDWGQVVSLSVEQRCLLAGMYIAVAAGDDPMSADCMRTLGGRTVHDWDWTHAQWAKIANWSLKEVEARDVGKLVEVIQQVDPTTKEAESVFVMTFKNQLYTRQVVAMLGFPGINSAVALRETAEECLRMAGWPIPKPREGEIPMPQEVSELMNSGCAKQAPKTAEDRKNLPFGDKLPGLAPKRHFCWLATATVLASYALWCSTTLRQLPLVHRGSLLLVITSLGALLLVPALGVYVRSSIGSETLSDPGEAGAAFGANAWESDCESRREGFGQSALINFPLWPPAAIPLPLLLGISSLLALLGRLAATIGSCLRPLVFAGALAYNAWLTLHLAQRGASKGAQRSSLGGSAMLGLSLSAIYATQHWMLASPSS